MPTAITPCSKYDVLAFKETKPKHGTLPDQPNSRGVVIYINEQLQAKVVQPTTGTIFYDAIWTSIKEAENATLLLGCIYRSGPPTTGIPRDVALHEAILWSANHSGFSHVVVGPAPPLIKWGRVPTTIYMHIGPWYPPSNLNPGLLVDWWPHSIQPEGVPPLRELSTNP